MSFDLGMPVVKTCDHAMPVFGCGPCIQKQHDAWGKRKYDEWFRSYKFPKCKCGNPTKAWEWSVKNKGLSVLIGCTGFDADQGYWPCQDDDFELTVP